MAFVPRSAPGAKPHVDVTVAVVALAITDRLVDCLDSLRSHASAVSFDVVVVVNPGAHDDPDVSGLPSDVIVLPQHINLGWAGGLHAARAATTAPFLAWMQDDAVVLPGWLDALVEAASARPDGAAFGAQAVDADGKPEGFSGGDALPYGEPGWWNQTDPTRDGIPAAGVEPREWVTSKGLLVRTQAWDDVGGPCARHFPLHHVDKEFSAHLRCHGWELYVVPDAQLRHLQSQSAPGVMRHFLEYWHEEPFAKRWAEPMRVLHETGASSAPHECHGHTLADVEREVAWAASRMLVAFSRHVREDARSAEAQYHETRSSWEAERARLLASTSWRVTAPLRWFGARLRRPTTDRG